MRRTWMVRLPCILALVALTGLLVGCEPEQPNHQMHYPAPQQPQQHNSEQEMPAYPSQDQTDSDTQQDTPMQWPAE